MAAGSPAIAFEPIKDNIGARVLIDKSDLLTEAAAAACREALEQRGVLLFPGIGLDDAEQIAFTDMLGERGNYTGGDVLSQGRTPGGEEDIYTISLDETQHALPVYVLATFFWHIDGAVVDQPLPKGTVLSARTLSATGGQTEFANLYAAYEQLSEEDKQAFEDLRVEHNLATHMRNVVDNFDALDLPGPPEPAVHPLVWKHPSGRRSLILGTHADRIVGMPLATGRSLLQRLNEWAAQPAFTYRHEWQVGDLVVWNNHGLMHRVVPYDDRARTLHRTTIARTELVA